MPPAEPSRLSGSSRPLPRALLLVTAALLAARVATGVWEARHAPTDLDLVAWVGIADAEAESRLSHKPILYDFSAAWCGPCRMMTHEIFADPRAARQIGRLFVPVRVVDRKTEDGHNPSEVERLQNSYAVTGFPTLVVVWPDGGRIETLSGYRGRGATISWMVQMATFGRVRSPGALPDSSARRPGA